LTVFERGIAGLGKLIEIKSLRDGERVFKDRSEAAGKLARLLKDNGGFDGSGAIVLGIPSGGVPVASGIAAVLGCELDLIIVRKVQIPECPEAGFGAVGPGGEVILNTMLMHELSLTENEVKREVDKTKEVINKRDSLFRGGRPFPDVSGRTVIIADDGLASGYTMNSAVEFVQRRSAARVVVAVPTAPMRTIDMLLAKVEEVYCLNVRTGYTFAVADAYENWYDLPDNEVTSILKKFGA
jgi:predicted phosphoribosyltransferase